MKAPIGGEAIRIVETKDIRVAILDHRGDPALIGESVRRFIAWRKAAGLPPRVSATFNIIHHNPRESAPDDYRCGICAATEHEIAPNDAGIVAGTIPGGRCAVLRHTGSDDGLGDALSFLYLQWLSQSGEELRDFPVYLQRVTLFPDVPDGETVTDIYLPLR